MDKHSTQRLVDSITPNMSPADVDRVRLHLETLIERYHAGQDQIGELEAELAYANFDRKCLEAEKRELETDLIAATEDEDDAVEELIAELIKEGIQRDEKIAAVKYIKGRTGWSLLESKKWVEAHYCE